MPISAVSAALTLLFKPMLWSIYISITAMISLILLAASGCSSQPTLGDRMVNQGAGTTDIGKDWSEGNDRVNEGKELIEDGNEMIEKAQNNQKEGEEKLAKGKQMVEQGKLQMEQSEKTYQNRFPHSYQRIYQNK